MNEIEKIKKVIATLKQNGEQFTFKNYTNRTDSELYGGHPNSAWEEWQKRIKMLLDKSVAIDSEPFRYYLAANKIRLNGNLISNFQNAKDMYLKALTTLENIFEEGDYFNELLDNKLMDIPAELKQDIKKITESIVHEKKNKVFIVHGHDHLLKTELEIFLTKLQLEPIVLHREVDGGQTLIEKFEANSDVSFVFVLLTPDEVAHTSDQLEIEDQARIKEFRARPNVIFEFGYFVGKIGRKKVCALHKGNVTLPSDLNGVIFKKVDKTIEDIGFALIKELKASGLSITI